MAAEAAVAVVKEVKKQSPVLMPDRFGLEEEKQRVFVVDLPAAVTLDEAMEPSYWAHVAEQMQPFDEIKIRAEDGSFIAYLVVGWCERNFAHVVMDRKINLSVNKEPPVSSVKHRIDWKGAHLKFCVIRNSDNKTLHEGERTKDEATRWLREYETSQGR